jgi:steroid delta-isomerase-like uncharacterized protein
VTCDIDRLVERYYSALNAGDFAAFAECVTGDLVVESSGQALDLGSFLQTLQMYRDAFPDLHHKIRNVVHDDTFVAVVTETSGTHMASFLGHPPSFRGFRVHGMELMQLAEDRVRQVVSVFDTLGMLAQLGLYDSEHAGG